MPKRTAAPAPEPHRPRVRRGNADDANRLRADLVSAAMALFAEGGLAAVSVRAVAARAGVSPMTTYRYFADKSDLLGGLWQSVFDALFEHATQALAGVQGARERHRVFAEAIVRFWETHLDQFALVHGFTALGQDRGAKSQLAGGAVYGRLRQLGVDLSEALAREVGGDPARAPLASEIRLAMTLGYLHGTLVATRYPWTERAVLRAEYLDQIEQAVLRCLRSPLSASSRRAA